MSEELQQKLRNQLWTVANTLRGNMSAGEFMYFSLGFIFYKYLSEKIEKFADEILADDKVTFRELWKRSDADAEELKGDVKTECLENIGYFVEPPFLFSSIIESIKFKENILPMLERSLKRIEDSTLGQESEEDFGGLFSDIDLASPKLGKTADDKNTLISNVLLALDDIPRRCLRVYDFAVRGRGRQKGWRVLHATGGEPNPSRHRDNGNGSPAQCV